MKKCILGAINKTTNKYENIINVNKNNSYKCIGCNSDLILRKGEKNFQSFIHKNKCNTACNYFKEQTIEQLKNDAKLHLRELLIDNNFVLKRRCDCCKFNIKIDLPIISSNHSIAFSETNNLINVYDENENENLICTFKMILINEYDETLDEKIYQLDITQLIHTITRNFATQKVELICFRKIVYCNNCLKYKDL